MRQHHNRAVRSPTYFHDGISLDFRFGAGANCYVKVPGGAITRGALTNLFTFTGDNKSYYMGPAGLLIPSVTNTPRVEYTTAGECLGLKMEMARTNLCLHSCDGTNAAWTKSNCTPAKTATGPDGVANSATTLTATAGNATCLQSVTSASATRAGAIWLKRRTGTGSIQMTVDGGTTWTTKTITASWARYEITQAAVTNPSVGLRIVTSGDAVDFWNQQLESALFASSDIPTGAASETRAAETCTRTLGSEFSATAGTVALRGIASGGQDASASQYFFSIDNGTADERYSFIRLAGTNTARYIVRDNAAAVAAIDDTFANNTAFRAALAWAANDFCSAFNGVGGAPDTAGALPTVTTLTLGHAAFAGAVAACGHIASFDYWPVRHPNNFLNSW